jgi:hypothetical protein
VWAVVLGVALAGNPWKDLSADVVAAGEVPLTPEQVTARLSDLDGVAADLPDTCWRRWAVGLPPAGVGARARVTTTASWMRRRLTLQVAEVDAGRRVDWDHLGDRGWVTRWTVEATSAATSRVTYHTYLNPPPWPFRRLFHELVRPVWEACAADAIASLTAPAEPR